MTQRSAEICLLTKRGLQKSGYSRVRVERKDWLAHRLAYLMSNGPIPKDKMVLHHCDVRNCINPKHLYLGTAKDNMRDCLTRNRHPQRLKEVCRNGHPYNQSNLYVRASGHRVCRTCVRDNSANWKSKYPERSKLAQRRYNEKRGSK